MKKQDIFIAINGIIAWRNIIKKAEYGKHESPRFFEDTKKAIKELKKLEKLLED